MFKNKIDSLIEEVIKSTLLEDESTIEINYNADDNKISMLQKEYDVKIYRSGRDKIKISGDSRQVWQMAKDFHAGDAAAAKAHPQLAKKVGTSSKSDKKSSSSLQKIGKDKFKGPDGQEYKIKTTDIKSTNDVKDYYKGNKDWENLVDKYKDEIKAYGLSNGSYAISSEFEDEVYDWIDEYGDMVDGNTPAGPDDTDGFDDFYDAHFGDSDPNAQRQDMMDKD